MKITHRLTLELALVLAIFATTVAAALWQLGALRQSSVLVAGRHAPPAQADYELPDGLDAAPSALRAWIILGDQAGRVERAEAIDRVQDATTTIEVLVAGGQDDVTASWRTVQDLLQPFRTAQDDVERIALSPAEQPALQILTHEATPPFDIVGKQQSAMIDEESGLAAKRERKNLLRQMADMRGPFGLAGADMRS